MFRNQRTILIVDDSAEDREIYRRYLLQDQEYCYVILEEETGEGGLALSRHHCLDGILLDFSLPDLDGLAFLAELKRQTGLCPPVIMLTGQGNEAIAVQAMKGGAQDYLIKGKTTPENLQSAIHTAIEHGQLKRELLSSEERFHTSVATMIDCFGIYTSIRDAAGQILDFRIDYVNDAACRHNQIAREEQLGKGLCELFPVLQATGLFEDYCRVVETGQPLIQENLVYSDVSGCHSLSRYYDLRVTKLEDGFVACWRDVTQRQQIQAALQQQLLREQLVSQLTHHIHQSLNLLEILQATVDGVREVLQTDRVVVLQLTSDRQGAIAAESVADEWPSLLTLNCTDSCLHNQYLELYRQGRMIATADLDASEVDPCYARLLKQFQIQATLVMPILTDERLWGLLIAHHCATPRQWQTSEIALLQQLAIQVGIALQQAELYQRLQAELQERQETELALRNSEERLRQALAKLDQLLVQEQAARDLAEVANRAKDDFVAVVTHDLRNPLNAILGWVQILKNRSWNSSQWQQGLETIERSARAQAKLLEDLLDMSRIIQGKLKLQMTQVNLKSLIIEAMNRIYPTANAKNIHLESILEATLEPIAGDPNRLQQVLANLLSNAVKFTPPGGRVQVRLEQLELTSLPFSYLQIQILDTGEGISPDLLPHIFDRFHQGEKSVNQSHGLGLGLAIARHLVELHGGTLTATSPGEGQGSTFTIQLPQPKP